MKAAIKKAWVAALRSGEYKQGRNQLRTTSDGFCCLGVLCNLHALAHPKFAATQTEPTIYDGCYGLPSLPVLKWAGLSINALHDFTINGVKASLMAHNDGKASGASKRSASFEQIADAIEAQL